VKLRLTQAVIPDSQTWSFEVRSARRLFLNFPAAPHVEPARLLAQSEEFFIDDSTRFADKHERERSQHCPPKTAAMAVTESKVR